MKTAHLYRVDGEHDGVLRDTCLRDEEEQRMISRDQLELMPEKELLARRVVRPEREGKKLTNAPASMLTPSPVPTGSASYSNSTVRGQEEGGDVRRVQIVCLEGRSSMEDLQRRKGARTSVFRHGTKYYRNKEKRRASGRN